MPRHGSHARLPRAANGAVLTLLLCLSALAGCGSEEEPLQRVAYCQGVPSEASEDGQLVVEFRQGETVVATGSVNVGMVFAAEVPLGGIQVYVDDVQVGAVNEGVDMAENDDPSAPLPSTYMASPEGCPDSPEL
mgnify:FL=1